MGLGFLRRRYKEIVFIFSALVLILIALPREDLFLKSIGLDTKLSIRRGLDLQGGVELIYEAQLGEQLDGELSNDEILSNTVRVIERRVNPGGASEAIVQTGSNNRIIVQIPGLENPQSAIDTIGQTAKLEFFEVATSGQGEGATQQLIPTQMSGADIKKATQSFEPTTSRPIVQLEFKGGESTEKFAELTRRISNSPNLLVALLDGQVVFGPATVQQPILDGRPQLSGDFNITEAKDIANLLNAGALPVPVALVAQQTIGPTLGAQALKQSLLGAAIGLMSVAIFLLIYYRLAGLMAVFSLVFYSTVMITIIKLSIFTPYVVVLTLAGIAGFILSIAVAVDANILIIERIKEEHYAKEPPIAAVNKGFLNAWSSIRDANAAAIIGAFILYWFGTPLIRGFALTLGVGVAISLVTALVISRFLLRRLARSSFVNKRNWLGTK